MAYAIDREKVSKIGEYGYEPAANQTGIVTPTFADWLDQGLAKQVGYNPEKAESILQRAGFKKYGGIYYTPDGKPLSFTMINIGGYSDWVASAQIVAGEPEGGRDQGNGPRTSRAQTYDNDVYNGHYQLAYDGNQTGGPDAVLRAAVSSCTRRTRRRSARRPDPNWERYSNPATDKLIEDYAATADPASRRRSCKQLEAVMVNEIPVIPVTEGVDWYQYNTKEPRPAGSTQGDPFARPAAYDNPDWGVMLLHLKPKA